MGSQTILDLIASTMVFGSLLLMALRINVGNAENYQAFRSDLVVQENLVAISVLLEHDFRRIGYCADPRKMPDPPDAIIYADTSKITYVTDIPTDVIGTSGWLGDGVLDTVSYYVGSTTSSEALVTPNPNDRLLYRVVNQETAIGTNLGVTTFNMQFYNTTKDLLNGSVNGGVVPNCREIQSIQITIEVQNYSKISNQINTAAFDTLYQSAYWRQVQIVAKNLSAR
jgi:hypothetical protein